MRQFVRKYVLQVGLHKYISEQIDICRTVQAPCFHAFWKQKMAWLNSCFPDSPQAAVSGKQKHTFRLISCIFFRQKRGEPFTLCPMFNNMHKPHVRTGICPQFPQFSTSVSPKVIHTIFIMIFRHFRLIHRLIHIIHKFITLVFSAFLREQCCYFFVQIW